MVQVSLVKTIRKPLRPFKRFYLKQRDARRFKRLLRPTDVFVVGHPKSGNTLMCYALAIAAFKDVEKNINLMNINNYVPGVHFEDLAIEKHAALPQPRLFRNEVPIYPKLYPKTIYLIRDPRAVLVSYYHMYRTIFNDMTTTLRDFVEEYLRNGNIRRYEPQITRWDRQVSAWLDRAEHDERVLIARYEDMVNKKPQTLKHAFAFADIECSGTLFNLVLKRSSFEAMRKTEEEFGEENYPGEMAQRGRFIRKGKISGWTEELPPESTRAIENEFGRVMRRAGYL